MNHLAPVASDDVVTTTRARKRADICLAGQKEAFEACLNGAPLATSLGILVRAAIKQAGGEASAAFFIADDSGTSLRHVVGMSDEYARSVEGFVIRSDTVACGLAAYFREPVITEDVAEDPAWRPWMWLSERAGYRACWSFPIQSSAGKLEGTFAIYFAEPRRASQTDMNLGAMLANAAAIIISRARGG